MKTTAIAKRLFCHILLCIGSFSIMSLAQAQATFLIWPIYPKIEMNDKATAVWLQNTGKSDAVVQIRVFNWTQENFKDDYNEQTAIIPSPPITKIKAGEKHMLRLTTSTKPVDGKEVAYRLIVDELPIQLNEDNDNSKVNFQMRYSIPLFVYGKGIGSGLTEDSQKINLKNPQAKPIISWYVRNNPQGNPELYLKNSGQKFARLSAIKINKNSKNLSLGKAAFGYVLANSTMKFEIDKQMMNELSAVSVIYGVDSSGIKQDLLEIKKEGNE